MELHQLQSLLAVIESGGYAPAGKALHLSHSAIHRQVRMLEQELGCRVLNRSGRTVVATESGRLLAALALRIHEEIADTQRQMNDLKNLRSGRLRIGTSSSFQVSFLTTVLKRFSTKFPGIHFHLITGVADSIIDGVLQGKLDVGILFNPTDIPRPIPELEVTILYHEEFDWAIAQTHPLAQRNRVTLAQLAAYPLITLPAQSHLRHACDRVFATSELQPTVITEVENEEAIDKLIEIDMGFALRLRRRPSNVKIHCFRIPSRTVRCEVGIVSHKKSCTTRAITEFIRICRKVSTPLAGAKFRQ
jgi:DNA-binding transcriptional LysR family regulator